MVLPATNYNFTKNFNNFSNTSLDPINMTQVASAPYTDVLGAVFWGIVFSVIFIMIWMRQEDITIPSIVGLLIGGSLWAFMPGYWVSIAMSLSVVSFAGLMYSILKGRS